MAEAFPAPRERGLQASIARLCGKSSASVSAWFNDVGKAQTIERSDAEKIIAAYDLPYRAAWLAEGTPPKLATQKPIPLSTNPDYPSVRRVVFRLSAGVSGYAIEYPDEEDAPIVFRRDWLERNRYKPESLFAVRVTNGSMEPGLYDGDTVVVNTAATDPVDGAVFAVNYEGELVIKRMMRDAGQWWLSSDNPDQARYPRKVCHEATFIIGRVVHKQSERI